MKYIYNKDYLAHWLYENHVSKKCILDALETTDIRSLNRWLNGAYMPIDKILKFCNHFHVNIDNFFLKDGKQVNNTAPSDESQEFALNKKEKEETDNSYITDAEIVRLELHYKDEIMRIKDEAKRHEDYIRNELIKRFDSIRENDKRHINDLFDMCKYLRERKNNECSNFYSMDTNVSDSDIEYVKKWVNEATTTKYGPRFEWDYGEVQERINNSQFIGYRINGSIEGYLTYKTYNRKAIIRDFVVNKKFRKKGIALDLVRFCLAKLREEGYLVVNFKYINKEAKSIAQKAGLSEYVKAENPEVTGWMYKCLVPTRAVTTTAANRLSLWKKMPQKDSENADFVWSLDFSESTLPILHYAYKDWYIGIYIEGNTCYLAKVKEFYDDLKLDNVAGEFIYLDKYGYEKVISNLKK